MNNNIEKLNEPCYQSIIIEINKSWERRRILYIYIYIYIYRESEQATRRDYWGVTTVASLPIEEPKSNAFIGTHSIESGLVT